MMYDNSEGADKPQCVQVGEINRFWGHKILLNFKECFLNVVLNFIFRGKPLIKTSGCLILFVTFVFNMFVTVFCCTISFGEMIWQIFSA
jgi:hypothetical protein